MAYYSKNRHIWLSIVSGLLLWFTWSDTIFGFLLHLAFIPLLIIESELTSRYYKRPAIQYFFSLFLTFLVWHILSVLFTTRTNITVSAVFINSCLMSIPMMLFFFTKRASGHIAGYFSFIIYWVAFEYLALRWHNIGSWPILGSGFASLPYLVQWYEITGLQGGSMWILFGNLILFQTIKARYINTMGVVLFSFLFILPSGASILRYLSYRTSGQSTGVTITYPDGRNDVTAAKSTQRNAELHNDSIVRSQSGPVILVSLAPRSLPEKISNCQHLERKSISYLFSFSDYYISDSTKASENTSNLLISQIDRYGSKKLSGFQRLSVCTKNSPLIGIMSANEIKSGETTAAYIRKGARFVFFISEADSKLHNQRARLRSIETRRDILLSSETAITGFTNQKGDYVQTAGSSSKQSEVIINDIRLNAKDTFYVKYGDYIGISSFYFALICIFILLGGLLVKRTNFI